MIYTYKINEALAKSRVMIIKKLYIMYILLGLKNILSYNNIVGLRLSDRNSKIAHH